MLKFVCVNDVVIVVMERKEKVSVVVEEVLVEVSDVVVVKVMELRVWGIMTVEPSTSSEVVVVAVTRNTVKDVVMNEVEVKEIVVTVEVPVKVDVEA